MTTETKTIRIGSHTFEGPYTTSYLEDRSGVYCILCQTSDGKWRIVDVGESATVKLRVENHDRKACWSQNCKTTWAVAVYYTPNMQQTGRKAIEKEIRDQYNPPCGKE